jgi:hypothetical protein
MYVGDLPQANMGFLHIHEYVYYIYGCEQGARADEIHD